MDSFSLRLEFWVMEQLYFIDTEMILVRHADILFVFFFTSQSTIFQAYQDGLSE